MKEKTPLIVSWSDWFDQAARIFDDPRMKIAYYKNGQTGEPYSEKTVRLTHQDIFKKLAPQKKDVVLDVGCGVGYFTKFFSTKLKLIVGVDASPHMIQTACTLNPRGIFFVAKADSLPFKGKNFHRIFSYGVTQYLPDESTAETMLDEMRRLLKDNGRILIGDILEPIHSTEIKFYNKATVKSQRWWPKDLDHNLTKLYLSKEFFRKYCRDHHLACEFFSQEIPGRSIPTPRYDVVITAYDQ